MYASIKLMLLKIEIYSRGQKKVFIPYFKRPKKYAILSDKRTVWALCVLVPYFNVLITSSAHISFIFTIIF